MNKQELIEKYFNNSLTTEDFKQLEQILKTDGQLKVEFFKELELKQHIAQEKHKSLKSRLQELDRNANKKVRWFPYAAAVIFLIGIGSFIYSLQINYHDLYAANFEVYPNVINPTTRNETEQATNETVAFELYEAGNYGEAAKAFNKAYEKEPQEYLRFYQAVCLLAQNHTEESIQILKSYDWEQDNSDFSTAANWYLGLAFLRQGQNDKAAIRLKKVANSKSNLSQQAQEILKALD